MLLREIIFGFSESRGKLKTYCEGKMNVTSGGKCSHSFHCCFICVLERLFGKGKQCRRQAGSEDEQKLFYRETDDAEG